MDYDRRRDNVVCDLDSLHEVAVVTCPYCVLPVIAGQDSVERGDFLAHHECQAQFERAGVYLTICGGMVVGSERLDPREATAVIEMLAKAKRRERSSAKASATAVEQPVSRYRTVRYGPRLELSKSS
jgi:hypothetical protein